MPNYRYCRVTDAFPPPWSGLSPGPYALTIAQLRNKDDVIVITKYHKDCKEIDSKSGINTYRAIKKPYLFEMHAIWIIWMLNLRKKIDFIHTHGSSFFFYHMITTKRFRFPIFMSIHSIRKKQFQIYDDHKIIPITLKERLALWKESVCIRNCDFFLPVSKGLKVELLQFYNIPEERIEVIGNAVPKVFLKPPLSKLEKQTLRGNLGLDKGKYLLFVGSLNGRKDVGQILKAMKILIKDLPDLKLLIIGSGPKKQEYKDLAKGLNLDSKVKFITNLNQNDLVSYYQISDCFILPSYYEGLAKVLLEAMATGLPIICSNIPGNNEVIVEGINGFLFENNDLESLANYIEKITTDDLLVSKMRENNIEAIKSKFTWEKVAERCNAAYKRFLNAC